MAADARAGREGGLTAAGMRPLAPGCEPSCPGCRHRRLSDDESAAQKQRWLAARLAPWAHGLSPLRVADTRRDYRDRVVLAAEWHGDAWRIGLRRRDTVIAIPDCPVHSPRVRAMVGALARLLPPAQQLPLAYYVQSGRQATLVVKAACADIGGWLSALEPVMRTCGLEGLWLHLNPSAGRRVLAKQRWRLLWGQPRSVDAEGLCYGPGAFQQLQPALHAQALDAAEAFLEPDADSRVIDLYCGVGASLRRWTVAGADAIGVEAGREAVACARLNAPRAQVLVGYCATRLPQLRDFSDGPGCRLLYANPPRTGLEPAVCDWIGSEYAARRMAYLSCSAGTLARDLALLETYGFRVEQLIPFDFFPQTQHVETLALLVGRGCARR